ncbi:hypothetical protein HGM15179_020791 [Zosterops borbonicus]|uniref:Integrase catalytic domain-containing protein n=1 Tax=Zosterops borbonicus TaxID=364589 RepID=A0A8K1D9N9_9PASS|nr:hypothetical protein HGM15179_020791 [Zosterops borbonicus]
MMTMMMAAGGEEEAAAAAALLVLGRKSVNTTECVAVPSSEHVAEIVGRQGTGRGYKVSLKPPLQAEQPQVSQPVFIGEVLQPSAQLTGLLWTHSKRSEEKNVSTSDTESETGMPMAQSEGKLPMCKVTTQVQRAYTPATSAYSWVLKELRKEGNLVRQKAQLVQQQVTYLEYEVSGGQHSLGTTQKEAIYQTPKPQTVREVRTFLGMTEAVSKAFGIVWQLRTPYRPQDSGQVEKMNYMIKQQIAKICQETNLYWYQALPIALIRIRVKPRSKEKIGPFEILYGRPYELNTTHDENLTQVGNQYIYEYLKTFNSQLHQKYNTVFENQPKEPYHKLHTIDPGDWVFVKNFLGDPLQEKWDRPFQVLLTTFTAIGVREKPTWIHHT